MENNNQIAVGLDIGTTKIVAIVGRKNEYGKIEILGVGKTPSHGVKRGVVNNITQTIQSIKTAIDIAESVSGIKIENVVVGIAGHHIRSIHHTESITRENPYDIIEIADIKMLEKKVLNLGMKPGEGIIHVLPQEFKVDDQGGIVEPIGMNGGRLEASFHVVVGQNSSIQNIGRCVKNAGLKMVDIVLEPLASSSSVLSEEEKEAGVALIDIGGGTTDLAIFKDGIIRHTAVIPFGGNIITEDIKEACSIIQRQAEMLKVRFGSAWPAENRNNEIVAIPGLRGRDAKEVSLRGLSEIINARVKEIIDFVKNEIENYYRNDEMHKKRLIAGVVLTGGGAELKHLRQLVEYVTGLDARIGYPNEHLAGDSMDSLSSPLYATSIGLLMEGLKYNENIRHQMVEEQHRMEALETNENLIDENQSEEEIKEKLEQQKIEQKVVEDTASIFGKFKEKFKARFNKMLDDLD